MDNSNNFDMLQHLPAFAQDTFWGFIVWVLWYFSAFENTYRPIEISLMTFIAFLTILIRFYKVIRSKRKDHIE